MYEKLANLIQEVERKGGTNLAKEQYESISFRQFCSQAFNSQFLSFEQVFRSSDDSGSEFVGNGFSVVSLTFHALALAIQFYSRNIIDGLRNHVSKVRTLDILGELGSNLGLCHPVHSVLGRECIPAVRQTIMSYNEKDAR